MGIRETGKLNLQRQQIKEGMEDVRKVKWIPKQEKKIIFLQPHGISLVIFYFCYHFYSFYFSVLRIKFRALHMFCICPTSEMSLKHF